VLMAFIVDASVVGAWLLPDEANALAELAMARLQDEDALAPDLLWHEVRSLLLTAARRHRIAGEDIIALLYRLADTPLKNVGPGDGVEIVRLALRHQLSAYDGAYLALAVLQKMPLATADTRLAAAARAEGVPLIEVLAQP
jgi:predicted nucleic acid-binding protein